MRRPLIALLAAVAPLAFVPAVAGAKPPTAGKERCASSDLMVRRACLRRARAVNAANKAVLKKLRDSTLTGARGDGATVVWTFCSNGKYELATTSDGSTGRVSGDTWSVEHARTRQGGKWFDAIVTAPNGLAIAVAMRGGRWKVGVESFDEVSDLGAATRTNARASCAAL